MTGLALKVDSQDAAVIVKPRTDIGQKVVDIRGVQKAKEVKPPRVDFDKIVIGDIERPIVYEVSENGYTGTFGFYDPSREALVMKNVDKNNPRDHPRIREIIVESLGSQNRYGSHNDFWNWYNKSH